MTLCLSVFLCETGITLKRDTIHKSQVPPTTLQCSELNLGAGTHCSPMAVPISLPHGGCIFFATVLRPGNTLAPQDGNCADNLETFWGRQRSWQFQIKQPAFPGARCQNIRGTVLQPGLILTAAVRKWIIPNPGVHSLDTFSLLSG